MIFEEFKKRLKESLMCISLMINKLLLNAMYLILVV